MTVAKLRIRLPSCAFPEGLEARTAAFGAGCHARPKPLVVTGDAQPRWQRPVPPCSAPGPRWRPGAGCGPPPPPQAPGRNRGRAAALAPASAVMFSTRRTVAAGVRMQAVAATPIRIGPTVTPPLVVVLSTLYRMLAASMFGQISRLAESVSVESAR